MKDTFTFTEPEGIITITAKKEYAELFPQYASTPLFEQYDKHGLYKYMHNNTGPALVVNHGGTVVHKEYWINGARIDDEAGLKMEHDANFANKMDTTLES